MKTIHIAVTRSARPVARVRSRRGLLTLRAALASCAAGVAVAWGAFAQTAGTEAGLAAGLTATDVLTLTQGCEREGAVQCNDLGVTFLRGYGVPVDVSAAARAFERACELGSPDGCGNLGALYESGAGVPPSLDEAALFYDQACTLGCALACSNLGALYARGRGVDQDLDDAERLFTLACQTGSAAGCSNLLELTSPDR